MTLFVKTGLLLVVLTLVMAQNCSNRPKGSPRNCCTIPKLIDESTMEACKIQRVGSRVKRSEKSGQYNLDSCTIECTFNATNITANGMVDRDQLLAIFSKNAGDNAELFTIISTAINVCVDINGTAARTALPMTTHIVRPACNINSAAVYGCMHREVLLKCPVDLVIDSEFCTTYKTFAATCPPPPFT